jgi:hypothetical protein
MTYQRQQEEKLDTVIVDFIDEKLLISSAIKIVSCDISTLTLVTQTSFVMHDMNCPLEVFFMWGALYLGVLSITPSLCIARMYMAIQQSKVKNMKGKLHISLIKCTLVYTRMMADQYEDYAVTHVGNKYPSPRSLTMYRPP